MVKRFGNGDHPFEDKQALIKLKKDELKAYLGLSPADPLPKTLPSKLVMTAKPDGIPGPDGKTPPVDLSDGDTFRDPLGPRCDWLHAATLTGTCDAEIRSSSQVMYRRRQSELSSVWWHRI